MILKDLKSQMGACSFFLGTVSLWQQLMLLKAAINNSSDTQ